jgi:hypothetical protein
VLGDDDAVGRIVKVLETMPELEPVVLRRSPKETPDGYEEAVDGRSYLFDETPLGRPMFAAVVVCRSARLALAAFAARRGRAPRLPRRGSDFLATLGACELLVVAGRDAPPQRRERWRVTVTTRAARLLGVAVVVGSEPSDLLPHLVRD